VAQQAAKEVDPEAEVERLKILLSQREAAAEAITMDPEELRKVSQEAEEQARVKVQEEISKQISELKLEVLSLRKQYGVKGNILEAFEKNRDKIRALFDSLDVDRSGSVSYDEFMSFCAESSVLGEFSTTMEKLMTFDNPFEELDENGDGQVSWEEFCAWVQTNADGSGKAFKSNEEIQRLIDETERERKIAHREAEKWQASNDMLSSRVQGLEKMVQDMEDKMVRLEAAHKKEVAIWEQQAKMFLKDK